MNTPEEIINSLISIENLNDLSTGEALSIIAQLTDISLDLQKIEGIEKSIRLNTKLQKRDLKLNQSAVSHYYFANAYAYKRKLATAGTDASWQWEQNEIEKEIFHLRKALQLGKGTLPENHICPITTNLANLLNEVGRFIEAIELWNRVLDIDAQFSMALGNRGIGYTYYSRALYDQGQALLFLKCAYPDLKSAYQKETHHKDAKASFKAYKDWIESVFKPGELAKDFDVDSHSLGRSKAERAYRKWCLDNSLFLNPLNDLGPFPIAAQDVLCVPSIVVGIGEGPYYVGFYNQMKQEFASARYIYYEAITTEKTHFSDKGVLLMNTMDYPSYSLAVEKMKASYRISYSLFDKIAFFLNRYLELSTQDRNVSFRTIWYKLQKRNKGLRQEFLNMKNWPLRGLFWLSKDLFENKPGFRDALEPEASELNDIRNHLEHKYLKLHEDMCHGPLEDNDKIFKSLEDTLAHSIYRRSFQKKTLRLLKIARAALVYLSLGVQSEEQQRASERDPDKVVPGMSMDVWEDSWKV